MLIVPHNLEGLLHSRLIKDTGGFEWVISWCIIGVRYEIAEVSHVKLKSRSLPALIDSHIEKPFGNSLFDHRPDYAEGI
jgi:hypothetical protein